MAERPAETRTRKKQQQRYRRLTYLTVLALLLAGCGVWFAARAGWSPLFPPDSGSSPGDVSLSEDGPGEVVYAIPSAASIHSCPIRRLTPRPTDRGRADRPSLRKPWRPLRGFSYFVLFFTVFIVFYLISSYFHFFARLCHNKWLIFDEK